jgi:uncharacterized BrkB/YihY/UPF0761 family membrane protein
MLLDKIFRFHYFKIGFGMTLLLLLLFIPDLHAFSYRAFIASQHFLQGFKFIGLGYIGASVVICVMLPLLLFVLLFWFLQRRRQLRSEI